MSQRFLYILNKLRHMTLWKESRNILLFCKEYWWSTLLIVLVILTGIITFSPSQLWLSEWASLLAKVLGPTSIILGFLLGYPLIRKKLTESYITKQFDIVTDANHKVRNLCISLQDKYEESPRSNELTIEYIKEALNDVLEIRRIAIDASPNVFKYTDLIYQSLRYMVKHLGALEKMPYLYYKEQLSSWLNAQLQEVYDNSKSVGIIPSSRINNKNRLIRRLLPFVSDNQYSEIEDIAHSINFRIDSALLVIFFGRTIENLAHENKLLFLSCYEAAPNPPSFARLLYNSSIYVPPVIIGSLKNLPFDFELHLIGYNRRRSSSVNGEEHYIICTYANISNISFVQGCIHSLDNFKEIKDGYINAPFETSMLHHFHKENEIIQFRISDEDARQLYHKNEQLILAKLRSEHK